MKRIYIASSFCSSRQAVTTFENLHCKYDPLYGKEYILTDNMYHCTHAIIVNTAMPNMRIPKENVIGLAFEPIHFLGITPRFVEYAKHNIGKYYIGTKYTLPDPFIEHHGFMWHISPSMCKELPPSSGRKKVSIMISDKMDAPGHIYRHALVRNILKLNLDVDIWGRGCKMYTISDKRLKGEFNDDNIDMYSNYQFHIAIENFSTPHYYSEKILNPMLTNTVPVYWGCKNIHSYFDNILTLHGDLAIDLSFIRDLCNGRYDKYLNYNYHEPVVINHTLTKCIHDNF